LKVVRNFAVKPAFALAFVVIVFPGRPSGRHDHALATALMVEPGGPA